MKYELLKSIDTEITEEELFESNCQYISNGKISVVVETAESVLGTVTAQLKAGKNPFFKQDQELPMLHAVRGLMALRTKEVRDAAGIGKKGMPTVAAKMGEVANITDLIKKVGAGQKGLITKEMLTNKDTIQQLIQNLDKLRMAYSKVASKTPQSDGNLTTSPA